MKRLILLPLLFFALISFAQNPCPCLNLRLSNFSSADPTANDGYFWYRSDLDKFRARVNGVTENMATESYVTGAYWPLEGITALLNNLDVDLIEYDLTFLTENGASGATLDYAIRDGSVVIEGDLPSASLNSFWVLAPGGYQYTSTAGALATNYDFNYSSGVTWNFTNGSNLTDLLFNDSGFFLTSDDGTDVSSFSLSPQGAQIQHLFGSTLLTGSYEITAGDYQFAMYTNSTNEGLILESPFGWATLGMHSKLVDMPSHGFDVGDWITLDSSGDFILGSDPNVEDLFGVVSFDLSAGVFLYVRPGEYIRNLTGLTAGTIYYAQTDGTLGTTKTNLPILQAISTTEGILFPYQSNQEKSITVSISSAEILALNATPKTLIAAPGAGKLIQVISITTSFDYISAAYATNTTVRFEYGTGSSLVSAQAWEINGTSDTYHRFFLSDSTSGEAIANFDNQPIVAKAETGNPTAGDGTGKVYITYRIIDL